MTVLFPKLISIWVPNEKKTQKNIIELRRLVAEKYVYA